MPLSAAGRTDAALAVPTQRNTLAIHIQRNHGNGYFNVILDSKDIKGITKMDFKGRNYQATLIRDAHCKIKRANRADAKQVGIDLG